METRQIMNGLGALALSFGLMGVMALPVNAVPPRAPMAPEAPQDGRHIEMMLETVDATAAQREQIEDIRDSYQGRIEDLHAEGADLRVQLEAQREGMQPVDISEVRPLAERVGDLMAEGIILRSQMKSEIASVLTIEQREKIARLQALRPDAPRADRTARRRH
jgi:Spy/CpxP family protein refolding chaperone